MLLLARSEGQRVLVPQHELSVMVVEVKGGRVVLGFDAPVGCAIHREEVYQAMQQEGKGRLYHERGHRTRR